MTLKYTCLKPSNPFFIVLQNNTSKNVGPSEPVMCLPPSHLTVITRPPVLLQALLIISEFLGKAASLSSSFLRTPLQLHVTTLRCISTISTHRPLYVAPPSQSLRIVLPTMRTHNLFNNPGSVF